MFPSAKNSIHSSSPQVQCRAQANGAAVFPGSTKAAETNGNNMRRHRERAKNFLMNFSRIVFLPLCFLEFILICSEDYALEEIAKFSFNCSVTHIMLDAICVTNYLAVFNKFISQKQKNQQNAQCRFADLCFMQMKPRMFRRLPRRSVRRRRRAVRRQDNRYPSFLPSQRASAWQAGADRCRPC